MSTLALAQVNHRARELAPGLSVSLIAAGAASFLAEHYGAPVMLFALLLGLALNFLASDGKCKAGIEFPHARYCAWAWHCWACASPWSRWQAWAGRPSHWW